MIGTTKVQYVTWLAGRQYLCYSRHISKKDTEKEIEMAKNLENLAAIIGRRTGELDRAERAGNMREYDRLLKDRGAKVLEALQAGASEDYLRQICR